MVKKKEAVADSVESTRQNELPKETRAITCPKCDPKRNKPDYIQDWRDSLKYLIFDSLRCRICGTTLIDLGTVPDSCFIPKSKRAAISVSDGGGSDASRASSPNSVPANAQGTMEGEIGARCDHFYGTHTNRQCNLRGLFKLGDYVYCRTHFEAHSTSLPSLPSVTKEQPEKGDLEEKEGERVGGIYSASEVLPSLDLEEKEAVTRNTAVLQVARELLVQVQRVIAAAENETHLPYKAGNP